MTDRKEMYVDKAGNKRFRIVKNEDEISPEGDKSYSGFICVCIAMVVMAVIVYLLIS
jgi:hypothetical protein